MTPDKTIQGMKFYNTDCMKLMKETPDNYYELAIVDVPYGIDVANKDNASRGKGRGGLNNKAFGYSKKYTKKDWDKKNPNKEYFSELMRISKNQIIWGANHFISKIPYDSSCWIVWDKDNGNNDFADCELAWTSFNTAVRKIKSRWHGMLQQDMKNRELRIYPTQKPVALYKWLLKNYAKEGDKILDTHMGSGSIAIACHYMGFDLTACELDKEYYEQAMERIENQTRQTTLV